MLSAAVDVLAVDIFCITSPNVAICPFDVAIFDAIEFLVWARVRCILSMIARYRQLTSLKLCQEVRAILGDLAELEYHVCCLEPGMAVLCEREPERESERMRLLCMYR